MTKTNQAPDPSMEEILASIRRIISDDDVAEETADSEENTPEPAPEPEEDMDAANADIDAMMADMEAEQSEPEPEPEDGDDIFDLTEVVEDDAAAEEAELTEGPGDDAETDGKDLVGIDDQDLAFTDEPEPEMEPEPELVMEVAPEFEPEPEPEPLDEENLLSADTAAEASAAFGVLANTILMSSGNSRTLEDLVQDLLRPMLKSWLDDNLPDLVEQLVREEIERVARKGR